MHCDIETKTPPVKVEWCGYLENHARCIYAMVESPEHEAAVRLADKIKAGGCPVHSRLRPFMMRAGMA